MKIKLFISLLFSLTGFIFAQNFSLQDAEINQELQDNFTIVNSQHNYDLNPHTASYSAEAQILTGLYEGLFTYDPITLDPSYAIAKSFRISRDKKRWTFILRDDAKFSDGSPIKAQDIIDSWIDLLAEPAATYSSLFDIVEGAEEFRNGLTSKENVSIKATDEYTISLHLKNPASHLTKLLCMPCFAVTKKGQKLYSGPFVLQDESENGLILVKNENYYDSKKVPLNKISILYCNDESENTYNYNTGKIDWLSSTFNSEELLTKDSIQLFAEYATQFFFFKLSEHSIWNNAEFRQALLEATPWDELRANSYVKASTLVYPLNGYKQPQGYVFTDKNEAALLLKEAKESKGISFEERLSIRFAVPDNEYMMKKAEILKNAWLEIGVDMEIIPVADYAYLSNISLIDADLFTYTWIGDFADPLAFLELFRGNSTLNVSNWKNEEFDRLLDESALYSDENHNKLLSQAEQLLLDEAVILPIQHPVSVNLIDLNAVGGWSINAFDIHPMKYLFKRETKDKIPNVVMLIK
ncbi:MAG: peptide ABC transporter substrate-binding protein [Treponema sp.]|nr:peptide ABC transporter substrate-binding protein [Treponema sp.]